MSQTANLFLFTSSYPFGTAAESTFLQRELVYLKEVFDEITIIPRYVNGDQQSLPIPTRIDESLADALSKPTRVIANQPWLLWKSIFDEVATGKIRSLHALKSIYWAIDTASVVSDWINNLMKSGKVNTQKSLFYTYWLGEITFGLVSCNKDLLKLKIVSRAHGIDLYEYRRPFSYIPFRKRVLVGLNKLFLISDDGKKYLSRLYPMYSSIYEVARLGVNDPCFTSELSHDGTFRLVSCSYVSPVKRLDLMVKGLILLAKHHPDQRFEWTHFGGGYLLEDIRNQTLNFPENISVKFPGNIPNEQILLFYKNNPVDLFINVSTSEGIPVSIMEAMSYGIPVVATAVGGTPEAVSERNGYLLGSNPLPEEIANTIWQVLSDKQSLIQRKIASKHAWQSKFDSETNYLLFADKLRSMLQE